MNIYAYINFLFKSLFLSSYQYITEAYLLYLLAYKFLTNHFRKLLNLSVPQFLSHKIRIITVLPKRR